MIALWSYGFHLQLRETLFIVHTYDEAQIKITFAVLKKDGAE